MKTKLEERVLSVFARSSLEVFLGFASSDFLRGRLDSRAIFRDRRPGLFRFRGLGFSEVLLCFEGGDAAGSCGRVRGGMNLN